MSRLFDSLTPDLVIHAAAVAGVAPCNFNPDYASLVNSEGTQNIVEAAKSLQTKLIYISTGFVFDGNTHPPYLETDTPRSVSVYAQTKRMAELAVLDYPNSVIIRTLHQLGYNGPDQPNGFVGRALIPNLKIWNDFGYQFISVEDVFAATKRIVEIDFQGILHLASEEKFTLYEMARKISGELGKNPDLIQPINASPEFPVPQIILDTQRARKLGFRLTPLSDVLREIKNCYDTTPEKTGRMAEIYA